MKRKWATTHAILVFCTSCNLFAIANAPIQRIDITNLLWNSVIGGNGGATKISVKVDFENGGSVPCFTKTLPFQASVTVWADPSQPCTKAITSISVTPLDSEAGIGTVYLPPPSILINSSLYLAQITIIQNTAPVFDLFNGSLISSGTARTTSINRLL